MLVFACFSVKLYTAVIEGGLGWCGTCHMASLFSPLPRTVTTTSCSSSSLLVATLPLILPLLPSHDFLASTKSSRCYFPPRSEGTNATSSSSSCLHSWCIPHNYACYQLTCLNTLIKNTSSSLILIRSSQNSEEFYCRNGILATNNISTASAPHQRC